MATMIDSIAMTDKMSTGFRSVNQSMSLVLDSFGAIRYASYNMMDNSSFQTAQTEINKTSIALAGMEEAMAPAPLQAAQNEINKTSSSLAGMERILSKISYKKVLSISGQFFKLTDTIAQTTARLDLMKGEMETVEEIQQKIFNSAQESRSSYLGTAAAVAKIGTMAGKSFGNTDEIIAFTELMNKNFIIGGASVKDQSTAMTKLTQAMAEGKLQGEGLQAVMGFSPLLAQGIEEQMRNAGVGGTMADWAKDGRLTTDVIKAAAFSMSDEIEQRFNGMPMTWSQIWQGMTSDFLMTMEPLLQGINWIAKNWTDLGPIVWGVAGAMAAYAIASNAATIASSWGAIVAGAQTIALMAQTVGYLFLAAATGEAAFAQRALNTAMMLSPMSGIILGIGLAIFFISKLIQSAGGLKMAWLIAITFLEGLFNGFCAFVLLGVQGILNAIFAVSDELGSLLNLIPGIEIPKSERFTFGDDAWESFETRQKERKQKIEDARAEADAAKAKEDGMDSFLNGMGVPLEGITNNTANTANNTRSMADSMSISEEDIKYLRDIAEREVINRFTTADLSVTMQTTANVNSDLDIDGVISQLENKTYEMLIATAEGV